MTNVLTLKKLKKTDFSDLYRSFMLKERLQYSETESILSIAVFLINRDDEILQQLGYRIIVEYSNQTHNYYPLYEIAVNKGLYPISKFIEQRYVEERDRNFFTYWNDAYTEQFRKDDLFLTKQQFDLNRFYTDNFPISTTVVAPTSYGKSELIIQTVQEYLNKRICIVTSTKALLMQTKKRIVESGIIDSNKIIVHPEMYKDYEDSLVAVLTQERLLRLLKIEPSFKFDCIVIDEAHEMLENNLRSNTLASIIIVAKKRNPNVIFKFFTPFVSDANNLQPRYIHLDLSSYKVCEYIKTEKYYIHDIKGGKGTFFYDQFMDECWKDSSISSATCEEELVCDLAASKNIVYLNKPVDIEEFAKALAEILPDIDSPEINDAVKNIESYLQPQYNLTFCLRKGVIYHHGSVPDVIRTYIEELYKSLSDIKFVITTSTLLSGVNLPAEKIFVLDNKKGKGNMHPEAFKNLIGRVCRFSEVFNFKTGNLARLEPMIHIVFGRYFSQNANYKNFIRDVARIDHRFKDKVDNVLLQKTRITKENSDALRSATEFVENYENGAIDGYTERYTTTDIGKSCIMNGIREIEIFLHEKEMQSLIDDYKAAGKKIDNSDELMSMVQKCFVKYIHNNKFDGIHRLKNDHVCSFYAKMVNWQIENKSYSEMISLFIQYWRNLLKHDQNASVYVGRWGEKAIAGSHNKQYIYLKKLNYNRAVNLAIVRIKEEKDFIDNTIMCFVETFKDLDLINDNFYIRVKYGTDIPEAICLLKNGFSLTLALLLVEKYKEFLNINTFTGDVSFQPGLVDAMTVGRENSIIIFELKNCI